MKYEEMQRIAWANSLGDIQWEKKLSKDSSRTPMEVGYVYISGVRELFCKRSEHQEFYLCNEFSILKTENI